MLTVVDAAHLLRRSGFGATQNAIAELAALPDREAAIAHVLDVSRSPSDADMPVTNVPQASTYGSWVKMTNWWIERMRTSPAPIVEKLTLFWHNHFVSSLMGLPDMGVLAGQHRTLRAHATGDFHALAQAIAVDPAMLHYLDNARNSAAKPQENFARELMELFTLGVGNYSQTDVQSMAKAWTGYSVDLATYRSHVYYPSIHSNARSVLFGKEASWSGPAALTEILRGAKAVESSEFITAKLFSYLAYPIKVGDPLVTELAATFRSSDLNILELVRAIFRSDAFWSPQAKGAIVRSPVEWMVATMQALDVTATACYAHAWLTRMGQVLFIHPNVEGWDSNGHWVSTAGAWGRTSFALGARKVGWNAKVFDTLWQLPPEDAVTIALDRFGIVEPTAATRAALVAAVARHHAERHHWWIGSNLMLLLPLTPEFQLA